MVTCAPLGIYRKYAGFCARNSVSAKKDVPLYISEMSRESDFNILLRIKILDNAI